MMNRKQRRARQGRNPNDGRDEAIERGRDHRAKNRGANPANRSRNSRAGR